MDKYQFRNTALGAVIGSAVGDALGAPFEFGDAGDYRRRFPNPVVGGTGEMVGGRGWKAGEFTDDTQMAIVQAESLLAFGRRFRGMHVQLRNQANEWREDLPPTGFRQIHGRCGRRQPDPRRLELGGCVGHRRRRALPSASTVCGGQRVVDEVGRLGGALRPAHQGAVDGCCP